MASRVPTGQTVEVRFTTVSFGTQETCDTDFIEIYDVSRASAGGGTTMTTRFCGNVRLRVYWCFGEGVNIIQGDHGGQRLGFVDFNFVVPLSAPF